MLLKEENKGVEWGPLGLCSAFSITENTRTSSGTLKTSIPVVLQAATLISENVGSHTLLHSFHPLTSIDQKATRLQDLEKKSSIYTPQALQPRSSGSKMGSHLLTFRKAGDTVRWCTFHRGAKREGSTCYKGVEQIE